MKKYFTRKELLETIIDRLEDYGGYYEDLHHEVFNTDYYIIGTYEAEQALKEYGIFEAVGKIHMYEKEHFGEVYTDLSDLEKVANMLWYILADELLWELVLYDFVGQADEETNRELIERLELELEDE